MIYSVIFNSGFSLTNTTKVVYNVVQKERGISLNVFSDVASAYVTTCKAYAARRINHGNTNTVLFPRLEDFVQHNTRCWYDPEYLHSDSALSSDRRYFAAVSPQFVAILITPDEIIDFLTECNGQADIRETGSQIDAENVIKQAYASYYLPRSAYLSTNFYYPQHIPLSTLIENRFPQLMDGNPFMVAPLTLPQNMELAKPEPKRISVIERITKK